MSSIFSGVNNLFSRKDGSEYHLVHRKSMKEEEAFNLPTGRNSPACAGGCCRALTLKGGEYSTSKFFKNKGDNKLVRYGGEIYHKACQPQSKCWTEVVYDGGIATYSGLAIGAKENPYIAATIATGLIAGAHGASYNTETTSGGWAVRAL